MSWQHMPFAVAFGLVVITSANDAPRWARRIAQILRERR